MSPGRPAGSEGAGSAGGTSRHHARAIERFSLRDRVVLLTGAGGGIGREFALGLVEAGALLAAHDRSEAELAPMHELLAVGGFTAMPFSADLASIEACRGLVADVVSALGRIDVLVNCAAAPSRQPIVAMEPETFDRVVAVNIRAPYFLSQAVHPHMRGRGGGAIVNIGSVNIGYGLATVSAYGLTKGALAQFTRAAAAEFAPDGIRVNCLVPGFIVTPMNAQAIWGVPRRRAWILDRTPMGRPGEPDDLVGALLFLASDASAFVTGQTLVVDGGFLAGGSWEYQGPER
jgi:NAD(P)-dependent dehydrogenase (short-subunit alcohol dehydrogenase family)